MKVIHSILGAFSEALAEGAVMLPNLMFVGLYYEHYGQTEFIMPFVLLYAFEKAGPFLLSGFGKLKNPYSVWLAGNITAILGCVLMYFGNSVHILWDAGAIVIGLGLSCFASSYRTVRDAIREKKIWLFGLSLYVGYLILGIYIVLVMAFRYVNMYTVITAILILVSVSTIQCILLAGHNPYKGEPVHEKNTVRWDQFLLAMIILLFTYVIRLYKQTAGLGLIMWIAAGMILLVATALVTRKNPYRGHSIRTLWYGAERNFVTIFSLVYFMAIGEYGKVTAAYVMIGLGVGLSKAVAPVCRKKIPEDKYELFCIVAANAASCLMLIPGTVCYMAGVLVTVVFVSMGNSRSISAYLKDERFAFEERRLVRSRFYGLGAVVEQAFMMSFFFIFSYFILGSGVDALSAYTFRVANADTTPVFFWSLLACILLNTVSGLVIAGKNTA